MGKRDYYDVLGISKDADEKEIKHAYRKLAKKYHPDASGDDKYAEQQFKEITEAYNVLSDAEKKKLYDQYGFAAFDGSVGAEQAQSGFDFGRGGHYKEYHYSNVDDSIFDDIFGDFFGKRSNNSGRKGRDVESDITISFEEAVFGCTKRFSFEGSQNMVEVKIPAGIDEGQSVRLKGKGHSGSMGMPAGDLYLKVHIMEKPGYERRGMDVYTTENIPYTTAVLGGEVLFHTLYGEVKCKIPAGTQSGSKIRLKQKGIVSMKDSSVHGDAYVTIQIKVPRSVTPREREMLRELEHIHQ